MAQSKTSTVDDSALWIPNAFYSACFENDLKKARETFHLDFLNEADNDGNTPLHIASINGYDQIIELLFQYHADFSIRNKQGHTADELAKNDEIKNTLKARMSSKLDPKQSASRNVGFEWIDSYENAYRIAYENREHLKQLVLQVPFDKLLDELLTGYIEKMSFSTTEALDNLRDIMTMVKEYEQPSGLIVAYTSHGGFSAKLNYDLAEIGSNFRFLSTQNLFSSGYLDNEPPKGLGQHIFAAIMMYHPSFRKYHRADTIFRGMNITLGDLEQYKVGDTVLTRSFLSTSKNRRVAACFIREQKSEDQTVDTDGKLPVLCVYITKNPQSGLCISESSAYEEEEEILIVPFVVFEVTQIDKPKRDVNGVINPTTIYLEERGPNIS